MTIDEYAKKWSERAAVEQPAFWEKHGITSVNDIVNRNNVHTEAVREFIRRLAVAINDAKAVGK